MTEWNLQNPYRAANWLHSSENMPPRDMGHQRRSFG